MAAVNRILAVKLADLGDVLLCEPALRSLRAGYPGARIDVLTTPSGADLVELIAPWAVPRSFEKHAFDAFSTVNTGSVSSAAKLALGLRAAGYDLVVLFHHLVTRRGAIKFAALVRAAGAARVVGLDNGRGAFLTDAVPDRGFGPCHEADYMLQVALAAGGAAVDPAPRLHRVELQVRCDDSGGFVGMFPATGAFSRAREWPAERFADLSLALEGHGLSTLILGGDDARDAAALIRARNPRVEDRTGRTTLSELAGLVAGARAAVGGDSFIGHLATAVRTPVVAIFGPSNYRAWGPYGAVTEQEWRPNGQCSGIIVSDDLPCSPCLYTGYALGRREGCPTRTCLDRISVHRVAQAIVRLEGAQQ